MTNVQVYSCRYLTSLSTVGVVRTTVQVYVGRVSVERKFRRSELMDELGHEMSLLLGYQESSVVGPVCDKYHQRFQQFGADHLFIRKYPSITIPTTSI